MLYNKVRLKNKKGDSYCKISNIIKNEKGQYFCKIKKFFL